MHSQDLKARIIADARAQLSFFAQSLEPNGRIAVLKADGTAREGDSPNREWDDWYNPCNSKSGDSGFQGNGHKLKVSIRVAEHRRNVPAIL